MFSRYHLQFQNIPEFILQRLKEADDRGIKINFVYGKKKNIPQDQFKILQSFQNIEMRFHNDLHAKCYYNEKIMIISSMNLHQYSQENNREMGVLISKEEDSNVYNDAIKEIESILGNADVVKERIAKSTHSESKNQEIGFCIRCEKGIKYDYYYPYCPDCYKTWKKFKDRNYEEKVCHSCKQEWNTSMNRPLCDMCFEEYKKSK